MFVQSRILSSAIGCQSLFTRNKRLGPFMHENRRLNATTPYVKFSTRRWVFEEVGYAYGYANCDALRDNKASSQAKSN